MNRKGHIRYCLNHHDTAKCGRRFNGDCRQCGRDYTKTRKAVCYEVLANGNPCGNDHLIANGKCSVHWKTTHTPTPWKVEYDTETGINIGSNSELVAKAVKTVSNSKENAAFIVRAVNAHEELVEIAKAYRNMFKRDDHPKDAWYIDELIKRAEGL